MNFVGTRRLKEDQKLRKLGIREIIDWLIYWVIGLFRLGSKPLGQRKILLLGIRLRPWFCHVVIAIRRGIHVACENVALNSNEKSFFLDMV
jgi:hypothetical protein